VRLAFDADLAAVLVVAALELDVVEHDEQVRLGHAVQVPEPRNEMGLMYGDDHPTSMPGTHSVRIRRRVIDRRA
jgi:hypothetical protein